MSVNGRVATPLRSRPARPPARPSDQARVERPRDQVFRPEAEFLRAIGGGDHVGLLGLRQLGDRPHGRELHLFVDRRRADIQRAAEDEREAEDVVDLVRVVRPPGRDDRVGPHLLGELRAGSRARGWRAPGSAACPPCVSTISGLSTPAIDTPRKMSAPSTMSPSVRAAVCGRSGAFCSSSDPCGPA